MKRCKTLLFLSAVLFSIPAAARQEPAQQPVRKANPFASAEEAENFLRTAEIVKEQGTGVGITNPRRLTLDDGRIRHDAVFKSIDDRKFGITPLPTGAEMDFKDSWKFEVAAYGLDKLLSLGMIPPTVERRYRGRKGSLQLWLDGCMLEKDRLDKNIQPPDVQAWNHQMYKVRIFDNLVYNIDRNLRNLLVAPDWKVYMIDHSRTFKNVDSLKSPEDMTYFSLSLMEALERLDESTLKKQLGGYLMIGEIKNLLGRRDRILELYRKKTAGRKDLTYP